MSKKRENFDMSTGYVDSVDISRGAVCPCGRFIVNFSMLIYAGRRALRQTAGVAADFCGICRRPAVVNVIEIRSQPHLYGVGIGRGQVASRLCQCVECKSQWILRAGTVQHAISPDAFESLSTLIEQTFPRFQSVYGERLAQESMILRDPFSLSSNTRLELIAEPFRLIDNDLAQDYRRNSIEKSIGLLIAVAAILGGIAGLTGFLINDPLLGCVALGLTICLGWSARRILTAEMTRHLRASIYPRLAASLVPLRPSAEELQLVMTNLKSASATQIRLADFMAALEDARSHRRAYPTDNER